MKFLAQRNIRDVAGFDVMSLQPVKIQANVIAPIKVTMTGNHLHRRFPGLYKGAGVKLGIRSGQFKKLRER